MKIACVIKPRADGTVRFVFAGKEYVFLRGAGGVLSCDVDDNAAVGAMLATDRFYPLQAEDEPMAQSIVQDAGAAAQRKTARRSSKKEGALL